jgi:exosome complex RNA-binding protein Csl4
MSAAGYLQQGKNISKSYILNGKYYNKYSSSLLTRITKRGDQVLGRVWMVRDKTIIMKIDYNVTGGVELNQSGVIPINKVNNSFITSLATSPLFKIGDTVLAEVRDITGSDLSLSTVEEDHGIVLTSCSFCGRVIEEYIGLNCPNCGYVNLRKWSRNYGCVPTSNLRP